MSAVVMVLMSDDEVAVLGHVSPAGFGALRTERGLLPLVAMEVDARVAGVIGSIEVAQTFVNTIGVAIEATYIFPLPDRAAVYRFRVEIAGRVIEGVVDERGAARQSYDQAIAAGHHAAITEEERPGVFTLRVGNLMPGEAATVRISLVGPLPVDDGEVTFRFPLVVAPRYMPGYGLGGDQAGLGTAADTNLVPDASRISPPVRLPGCPNPVRLGLRVHLEDHGLREIASSLHAVSTTMRDACVVEVVPGERLDRDFILRWRVDGGELRSKLVCADDADGRGGSFMLTMVPPSTTAMAAKPRDVVFVIDRSGSMGGWKMVAARRAAARMIDSLTARDRFCAIAFDNTVELLPAPEAALVAASDRNRFRAVELLAAIDARGGTEMAEPLRRAATLLAGGHEDRERVIVLVTDGQVGNEDHILRELVPLLRNVRVFTLGIDQAVNAGFLRRLAGAGGGLCELVESEDRLDAVMAKVHRRIGTPIATDLAVQPSGLEVELASLAPHKLPDVYAGAPVVIFGRYRGTASPSATIEIAGTSLGEPMRVQIARDSGTTHAPWIAASWARANIRDLEDQYAARPRPELEQQIVGTSKRFGVLSRFTAFVAIDRDRVVNVGGWQQPVVQPVEAPAPMAAIAAGPRGVSVGHKVSARYSMPSRPSEARPAPMPARMSPPTGAPAMRKREEAAELDDSAFEVPDLVGSASAQAPANDARRRPSETAKSVLPPPPPPAPHSVVMGRTFAGHADKAKLDAAFDDAAYRDQLGALGRELEAQGRGQLNPAAIRLVRQRLIEWIEDVCSVAGNVELVIAVERLVEQLAVALAGVNLASELLAVAAALATLVRGGTPPQPSRKAFWK